MILEKENYKKMTNTSTDIISGLEQYADSEGPRIDLNSLYDGTYVDIWIYIPDL